MVAGISTTSAPDLTVDDAAVLHNSNRLVVRLLRCDVLARVADVAHQAGPYSKSWSLGGSPKPIVRLPEPRAAKGPKCLQEMGTECPCQTTSQRRRLH